MESPIFIFSLPRSGSTLLQKILMTHKEVSSVAEPWLLLPFVYAYKKKGILAEYLHVESYTALEDFINNLPNKEADYNKALGSFANTLYEKQCINDEKYFLDKTPRYYNIIPEIAKSFPDAKFIFLFRNPVHVMSSIVQTWCKGQLNRLYIYDRDLNYGPKALSEGYTLLKNKAYALQYEQYILNPKKYTKEICKYLEIDFDNDMLNSFQQQDTKGKMGDPTGSKEYSNVNIKPLQKWKETFNTSFRKRFLKKYIQNIDNETLTIQGYNKDNILEEISKINTIQNIPLKDIIDLYYSSLVKYLKVNIWFGKNIKFWASHEFLS